MRIKVLLVDDHMIMREGLKLLLSQASDIDITAEASDGKEAIQKAMEYQPDIVVMDITMPEMGGIEAARHMIAARSDLRILVLSMVADKSCITESLKAGVKGYLLKDCAAGELVIAIRAIAAGGSYLSPKITDIVIREYAKSASDDSVCLYSRLSKREQEVLQRIAEGRNTKEIAFEFEVSIKTIEAQRTNIMKKLNLYNIADLTRFAVSKGLVSTD